MTESLTTFSGHFSNTAGSRRYKAPSGKVYNIWGALITNNASVANRIHFVNRNIEQGEYITDIDENFFSVDLITDGVTHSIMLPKPIRTKYLTIGTESNTNIDCFYIVYFELANAPIHELIWEFIGKKAY